MTEKLTAKEGAQAQRLRKRRWELQERLRTNQMVLDRQAPLGLDLGAPMSDSEVASLEDELHEVEVELFTLQGKFYSGMGQ